MALELKEEVKRALEDMDFVEKYENLSKKYDMAKTLPDERLALYDIDTVIDMFHELGYTAKYDKKEKFFQLKKWSRDEYSFGFNIGLEGGIAELIWVAWKRKEILLGMPLSVYPRLLVDVNLRIKPPCFKNYDELEEILKEAFNMFEEFQEALLTE